MAETKSLIYSKMVAVAKDVGAIGKNQKNTQQGFKFRGIDDMLNALYPALTKNGVFLTTKTIQATKELKDVVRGSGKAGVDKHVAIVMEYTFWAEDGSHVSSSIPAEGVDSGDKATNKALSAALKYALIQTFAIPTEDMEEADFTTLELGRETAKAAPAADALSAQTKSEIAKSGTIADALAGEAATDATPKRSRFTRGTKAKALTNGAAQADDGF